MNTSAPISNNNTVRVDDFVQNQGSGRMDDPGYIQNYEEYYDAKKTDIYDKAGDFTNTSGNYQVIDGKSLGALYDLNNTRDYLSLNLAVYNETKRELNEMMFEVNFQKGQLSDSKKSKRPSQIETTLKSISLRDEMYNQGASAIMTKIQTNNIAIQKSREAKIEDDHDHWYNYVPLVDSFTNDEIDAKEGKKANTDEYNAAMRESFKQLSNATNQAGLAGINADFSGQATDAFNGLQTDLFKNDKSGDYVDVPSLRKSIDELKKKLTNILNVQRHILAAREVKAEAFNLIFEASIEVKGSDSKAKAYQQLFEKQAGHTMSVFNSQATNLIAIAKLTNQSRYIKKQIDKMDSRGYKGLRLLKGLCQVAAIVISIIGACTTWIGGLGVILIVAGAGIGAAVSGWGASKIADTENDVYDPSNTKILDNRAIDKAKDKSKEAQMESVEDKIISGIDSKYSDTYKVKDGYKALDSAAIGLEYKALSGVQNAIRLLNEAKRMRSNLNNLVFSAHTGLKGISSPAILNSVLESHFEIKNTEFQFTAANQQDIVDSFNQKRTQQLMMSNATTVMWVSIAGAVAGALAGAAVGYGASVAFNLGAKAAIAAGTTIGFALGQTIGGGLAEIYNNKWSSTSSFGANYTGSIGKIRNYYMEQGVNTTAENVANDAKSTKTKNREAAVLGKADQLENEALADLAANGIADAGDGYSAINTDVVKKSLSKLQMASDVRSMIAAMHETKNEIANMFSAVSVETPNAIAALNRSQLQTNLQISSYIKQHLQEQIAVTKRARDAEKAVDGATTKMWVSGIATVACLGVGAAGVGIVAQLTTAIVGAANIGTDIYTNATYANKDNGQIKDPQGKQKAPDLNNKSTLEQIDAMENSQDFDLSMMENIGGGKVGINSGNLTIMENKTFSNMKVVTMIADARKAISDMQNVIAASYGSPTASASDAASKLISSKQTFILQGLQVKLQAMQNYIERQNEKADFTRAIWQKSFELGVTAVLIGIGVAKNANGKAYSESLKDNATASLDVKETAKLENTMDSMKTIAITNLGVGIINDMTETIVGKAFDAGGRDKETSERIANDSKSSQDNGKIKSALSGVSSNELDGAAQDILVDQTEKGAMLTGDSELSIETSQINARSSSEIGQSFTSLFKSVGEGLGDMKDKFSTEKAQILEYSKARTELKKNEDEAYKRLGAISGDLATKYKDSVDRFKAAETAYSQNASAQTQHNLLMAYADMVTSMAEIDTQLVGLEQSLAALQTSKEKSENATKDPENDKKSPIFINPDSEQLKTQEQVKQNMETIRKEIKSANTTKDKLEAAKTKEQIDAVLAESLPHEAALTIAFNELSNTVRNSQLMADVTTNLAPINFKAEIEAREKTGLESAIKKETGKEMDLEAIKDPDQLQQIYQDLYINNFVPAREVRQASMLLKNLIAKKLKGEDLSPDELVKAKEAITKLGTFASTEEIKLLGSMAEALAAKGPVSETDSGKLNIMRGEVEQVEGTARQSITSFNKFSGKLDSKIKELGRKGGLTPIDAAMLAIPASGAPIAATVSSAPSITPTGPSRTASAPGVTETAVEEPAIKDIVEELDIKGKNTEKLTDEDKLDLYKRLDAKIRTTEQAVKLLKPALKDILTNYKNKILPDDTKGLQGAIDRILTLKGLTKDQSEVLLRVKQALAEGKLPTEADIAEALNIIGSAEAKIEDLKEKNKKLYNSIPDKVKNGGSAKDDSKERVTVSYIDQKHQPVKSVASVSNKVEQGESSTGKEEDLSDLLTEIDGKLAITDKFNKVLQNQLSLLSGQLAEIEKEEAYA